MQAVVSVMFARCGLAGGDLMGWGRTGRGAPLIMDHSLSRASTFTTPPLEPEADRIRPGTASTASKAPRQRPAGSQPTTRRRSDVSSGGNSSMRRQLSLPSASSFYAEVVNRQAALHRVGSKSFPTLAKDMPPNMCMDMRSSSY
jgi:hypothetical protein